MKSSNRSRQRKSVQRSVRRSSMLAGSLNHYRPTLEPLEDRRMFAVFTNSSTITINDDAAATPYPSNINVPALPPFIQASIKDVNVTLHNLSHDFPDDIEVLVVAPGGQNVILMNDVGGSDDVTDITLKLDDAAADALPDGSPLVSGTFRPASYGATSFPGPAPAPSGSTTLSTFNGLAPGGTWQLFVNDDAGGQTGSIADGWSLEIILGFDVIIDGTNNDDEFIVDRDGDNVRVTRNGDEVFNEPIDAISSLTINGLAGNDNLIVDSSNGLISIEGGIRFDGGTGFDRANAVQTGGDGTGVTETLAVGALPGSGRHTITVGDVTQRIDFQNIEPFTTNVVAATFNITSIPGIASLLDAANAINYVAGTLNGPTFGRVTVDNFEPIEFTNKTNLVIDAGAGSDEVSLNNALTPTGLTSINVNGQDPTGSDKLVINGVAATTLVTLETRTITGASGAGGAVNIVYSGIEEIKAVKGTATTLAVASTTNGVNYTITPGAGLDEGTIQAGNVPDVSIPINFKGYVTVSPRGPAGGAFANVLTVVGTNLRDNFTVVGNGNIGNFGRPTVAPVEMDILEINGLEGDDDFVVVGSHPYSFIELDGGDPSASDQLLFGGQGGAITVDLSLPAITESGFGPVNLFGIEDVDIAAAGANLTVNGTLQDDVINYTPLQVDAGRFSLDGLNTQFTFSGVLADDTFTINGGAEVGDLVNVVGTNGPDFITVNSPTRTVTVENAAGTVLRPVVLGATVEEVTVLAGFGNDTTLVIPAPATATGPGGGNPNFSVPINLLINVDGGPPGASDALVIANDTNGAALPATDFAVINRSRTPDEGVVRVYRNASAMPDITFTNVEIVSPLVSSTNGDPNLLILGPDLYEQNEFRQTASFLGSGSTINLTNLAIFPNAIEHRFVAADNDWYRVVAQKTGTLDFQVYFRQYTPGLLPGNGDLQIQVVDVNGNVVSGFGTNDNNGDERVRIPAVAGQTYFVRVFGAPPDEGQNLVVNGYSMTIVNEAPPIPYDLELDDVIGSGQALAGGTTANFTASILPNPAVAPFAGLNATDDHYNGKWVNFLTPTRTGRARITDYSVNLITNVATFTLDTGLQFAPLAGDAFIVESIDTGRSQLDNVTRDATPTIFLRLDDGIFLHDLPGNGADNSPPDEVIPIPFSPTGATPGYRIAIFDEGPTPPQSGTLPQTPVGFASQVVVNGVVQEGVYFFTFTSGLTDGSHFITARVQMVDPKAPTHETGFGGRSLSLEIVVDTGLPPVFFGNPNITDDGLTVDPGVTPQPPSFVDKKTNDRTPTFWGTAEANTIVRLYADLNLNNIVDVGEPQLGLGVTLPYDGTNQFPFGQWTITSNIDLNNPAFFPVDGLRRILATAEDVAGNVTPNDQAVALDIFLDTQGPQVTGLFVNDNFTLIALASNNTLLRFNSADPTNILAQVPILGLQAGDVVVGIDRRPADGLMYAVVDGTVTDRIYTVDPFTGIATLKSTLNVNLAGTNFGVDFNPQADRLRVVSDTLQNLRINVDAGAVTVDGNINPASNLGGAAYISNIPKGAPTALYTIDTTTDRLKLQSPPNSGTQVDVGALGVAVDQVVGFDILPGLPVAYAALTVGGNTGLYTINLATGAATLVGDINDGDPIIVGLTAMPFDIFALKPANGAQGPTPLVTSLTIGVQDFPIRSIEFDNPALNPIVAVNPGHYVLKGDHNGIIPIKSITFTPAPSIPGQAAFGSVELEFFAPLPDDRYTLTMSDSIVDDVGNKLDGENNAIQPLAPLFATGDGQPGGNFIARFTVDTRPEIGVYAAASIFIDINGNLVDDPEGQDNDFTNRDLRFTMGVTPGQGIGGEGFQIHDSIFAGNFPNLTANGPIASGFDKLAAYGFVNGHFRWLIDTNHDGIINLDQGDIYEVQPPVHGFNLSALPIAGRWNPALPYDQIGLFDGTKFLLDTDGDFVLESTDTLIVSQLRGSPIAGDFDGDGSDDLATWHVDQFQFDLDRDGSIDARINFGFPGVAEKPVAADMDQDGIDDVGLFVPRRSGIVPEQLSEWYFLLSNDFGSELRDTGTVDTLKHPFSPIPLGQDLYAQYGDEFALPIVGNFDPPPTASAAPAPTNLGVVHSSQTITGQSLTGDKWYSFQTVRPSSVEIDVTGATGAQVQLYDANMNVVGSGAAGAVAYSVANTLPAAKYFVRVTGSASQASIEIETYVSDLVRFDVSHNGVVEPQDLLILKDSLNRQGIRGIDFSEDFASEVYFDTTLDGQVTPQDVLVLIDYLNRQVLGSASGSSLAASGLLSMFESSDAEVAAVAQTSFSSSSPLILPSAEVTDSTVSSPKTTSTSLVKAESSSSVTPATATPTASSYSTRVASRGRTTAIDTALADEDDWSLVA